MTTKFLPPTLTEAELPTHYSKAPDIHTDQSSVEFHPIRDIKRTDSLETIQDEDLVVANSLMRAVYSSWGQVRSIQGVCALVKATIQVTEHRRKVLGHPYGVQPQVEGRSPQTIVPLD